MTGLRQINVGMFVVGIPVLVSMLCVTIGARSSVEHPYSVSVPTQQTAGTKRKRTTQESSRTFYFAGWLVSYFGSSYPRITLGNISWLNLAVDLAVTMASTVAATLLVSRLCQMMAGAKHVNG